MTLAISRQLEQRHHRALGPRMRRLRAAVGFILILGLRGPVDAHAGPLTIVNDLPSSSVCAQGNTVSVFTPGQQVIQPAGNSLNVSGEFSSFPGLGIQVNNWYWTAISLRPRGRTDIRSFRSAYPNLSSKLTSRTR